MITIKRNLNLVIVFLFVVSGILSTSCEKNELKNVETKQEAEKESSDASKILSFNDHKEYSEYISKAVEMSPEERIAFESTQGFVSFGTVSEEFYCAINDDDFSSLEDVIAFVKENDDYLILLEDANGEFTLETKMFNNPERYAYNEEGLVKIGDKVYKYFDGHQGSVEAKNLEVLRNTTNDDVITGKSPSEISLKKASATLQTALEGSGVPNYPEPTTIVLADHYSDIEEEDNNRTVLEIHNIWDHWHSNGYECNTFKTYLSVKPYKRTAWVWRNVERTISYSYKVKYDRLQKNYPQSSYFYLERSFTDTESGRLCYGITKTIVQSNGIQTGYDQKPVVLKAVACWADTPSTKTAEIYKNSHLF